MEKRFLRESWKRCKRQGGGDQTVCERNQHGDSLMPLACPYVNRRCGLQERKRP